MIEEKMHDDLISRAEAIRIASGYCHPANIADELRKLPPAQPMRWIPCSERLPEYGQNVLVCYKDGSMGINHVIDEYYEEWFIYWVLAWMPLPEPWKGE